MNERHRSEIEPRLFRHVMGRFASGVTVITAQNGDEVRGMTASAFMSGSLEPPLCVVAVAKRAHMHTVLTQSDRFGVNVLAEDQELLSIHFAGRRVPGLSPEFDYLDRVPLLPDGCARMVAEIVARHDCGDHTLFIGHILHMEADGSRPPLAYHAGRYAGLVYKEDEEGSIPEFW
jgi:flavin reductase (DIM6/NTAB) family NADH-FMN oxidoreductase RutF